MEDFENLSGDGEQPEVAQTKYSTGRKVWLEFKDMLAGFAFPFILSVILSSSVIAFADVDELSLALLALIGGEIIFIVSLIIFGRANGAHAYRKTITNMQKRELNSKDERVLYKTGEYALWKSPIIAFLTCVPFILFQIIELCAPNTFTSFCLKYAFAWAYYPFSYLGKEYQALNFIMILLPMGVHTIGYHLGKLKEIKLREKMKSYSSKGRKE